jgi:pyrophosphate--fructose-6-phosphate 1-phosphotransferase
MSSKPADAPEAVTTVAMITCGRIAPCFGPAVGGLIRRYQDVAGLDGCSANARVRLIAYLHGFRGMLRGDVLRIGPAELQASPLLVAKGGSPIGASRTRLSNFDHLRFRGLIADSEDPVDKATRQLMKDNVSVLHIIGSSHAQITGQQLSTYLKNTYSYELRCIGLAKTIENDMWPIEKSLGAQTAAEQGALYFEHVVAEHNSNPRMLIIHEIKGRSAGWLTATTAFEYRERLKNRRFADAMGLSRENYDVHAVYTPEMNIDFDSELRRLRRCMDRNDNVNIFVAAGTMKAQIIKEARKSGKFLVRHPTLGYEVAETGAWFAEKLKREINAEKVLIQKSGVYVRAAAAGNKDRQLAQGCVNFAVDAALDALRDRNVSGVVGHDARASGQLGLVDFEALMQKKPFDLSSPWFVEMLASIGQPQMNSARRSKL